MFKKFKLRQVTISLIAFLIVGSLLWLVRGSEMRWFIYSGAIILLLLGKHYYENAREVVNYAWIGLAFGIILVFGFNLTRLVSTNVQTPPLFDFTVFWLNGQVATNGLDLYDPDSYHKVAEGLTFSPIFEEEILDVGFWYPPPSAFIFVPLGWFEIDVAVVFWYVILMITLLINILLLWRYFADDKSLLGLLFSTTIVLSFPAVFHTFKHGQTMFFALLCVLLFVIHYKKISSGVWLGLATITKPPFAILGIFLMIRKRWSLLTTVIIFGLLALLSSAIVFGFDDIFAYVTNNPSSLLPDFVYTEWVNQSLLATYLRISAIDFSATSPILQPVFLILAGLLLLITIVVVHLLTETGEVWGLLLTIAIALLIYPATLYFYSLVMLIVVFYMWKNRNTIPYGLWIIVSFAGIIYYFAGVWELTFWGHLICWIMLLVICSLKIHQKYNAI